MEISIIRIQAPPFLNNCLIETAEVMNSNKDDSVRMHLCFSYIYSVKIFYPEYQTSTDIIERHKSILEKCKKGCYDLEERKKYIADLITECRHAHEYHNKQKENKQG